MRHLAPYTRSVAPAGWSPAANQHNVPMHFAKPRALAGMGSSARTDLTQDIDGAFAARNLGSKHFSEIARSGNGNMRNDLDEHDTRDQRVLDGVGECYECMGLIESSRFDGLGAIGPGTGIASYRYPQGGEQPPYAPQPGFLWLRKLSATGQRAAGGTNVMKGQWVLVSKQKLAAIQRTGDLKGFGPSGALPGMGGFGPSGALPGMGDISMTTLGISAAAGIVGGFVLWFALKGLKPSKT